MPNQNTKSKPGTHMLQDAVGIVVHRLVSAFRRNDPMSGFWETRFDELATYNAEVAHGIQQTPQKRDRMEAMQNEYNSKLESLPGVIVMR